MLAFLISRNEPEAGLAWAVPVATDIAFAVGVLSLAGSWLPTTARVFLLSLAVVDDLGAIIVIEVLFTSGLNWIALLVAGALCAGYWYLQHKRITTAWLYVPLAVATWVAVHTSGIHATIAGVALGLLTRVRLRLYKARRPGSAPGAPAAAVVGRAGHPGVRVLRRRVPVGGEALRAIFTDRISIGIMVGLVVGKFIGIFGSSLLAVKLRLGDRPAGVGWTDLASLALLGGIGFTVSLLIAELSLTGDAAERAKAAVLIASALASVLGALVLVVRRRLARANSNGTAN